MLANSLSVLRILLGPLAVYSIYRGATAPDSAFFINLTVGVLFAAAATDLFDGFVARRLDQTSQLGKILDPVADKLFIGGVCAALVWWRGFPLWLLAIQVTRDLAIVTAGTVLLNKHHIVVAASRLGKYSTVSMALTMLTYAVQVDEQVRGLMIVTTTGLLIASTVGYGRHLLKPGTIEEESSDTSSLHDPVENSV